MADAKRGSVVEIDNAGSVSFALLVTENQNLTWLRASNDAALVCTFDGGSEREERLVEWMTVTLKLGVRIAVLCGVAVEVVSRSNGDVVLAVCRINESG